MSGLRAAPRGLRALDDRVTITVGGTAVSCAVGDTVAAALVAAGNLVCRLTEHGDPRGVFCGMGVCQECVMAVDGAATRACMTTVRDGMTVCISPPRSPGARLPVGQPAASPELILTPDLLVVGAGPAGLSAALAAAGRGAEVVLLDEREKPGGQYYKQPASSFSVDPRQVDRQYRDGRNLIAELERSSVKLITGAQAWGAARGPVVRAATREGALTVEPKRLVLAAGAYERGVPLPGWTLPGFMTTGAAQTLMRSYGVMPGTRVLVSGTGPLNIQVAAELVRAGVVVVALCETAVIREPARAWQALRLAAAAPDLALEGLGYARTLARARVPFLAGYSVVAAFGDRAVERASVARLDRGGRELPGTQRSFDVDAVCVGFGFQPNSELARSLGVTHDYDPLRAQLRARVDGNGRTNVEGVWVVGDGGGTGGARLARELGTLAGLDAARSLGLGQSKPPASVVRARKRNERFQDALARLFAAPSVATTLAAPGTVVCRCEEISFGTVCDAFARGIDTIGAVKRLTRAGMGRCGGRYCGPVLAELAAAHTGVPPDGRSLFAPAPPFKPLTIEELARPSGR